MICLPFVPTSLFCTNSKPTLGKNLHVLIPLIGAVACFYLQLPFLNAFKAHTIGIFIGNSIYQIVSFIKPGASWSLMQKDSFMCRHLNLIYLATVIATVALIHISISLAIASSCVASILGGYFYMNKDSLYMNDTNHSKRIVY